MTKHHKAYMFLRGLGYSELRIRRAVIALAGHTQKSLSDDIGKKHACGRIDESTFTKVLSDIRSTKYIQKAIAMELGIPHEDMFKS